MLGTELGGTLDISVRKPCMLNVLKYTGHTSPMRAALPNANGIPLGNQGSKSDSTRLSSGARSSSCFPFDLNNIGSLIPEEGGGLGEAASTDAWLPDSLGILPSPGPTNHGDFSGPCYPQPRPPVERRSESGQVSSSYPF